MNKNLLSVYDRDGSINDPNTILVYRSRPIDSGRADDQAFEVVAMAEIMPGLYEESEQFFVVLNRVNHRHALEATGEDVLYDVQIKPEYIRAWFGFVESTLVYSYVVDFPQLHTDLIEVLSVPTQE